MKRFLYIIILSSSCVTYAQEDYSSSNPEDSLEYNAFKEHVPYWRMEKNWKFTPFDIFSIVPTFGIDHEVKMNPLTSFQFGAAVIPSFFQFLVGDMEEQFNWMNGYRVRFESRFWGFRKPWVYVSTELSMRHLIINDNSIFGMEGDGMGNFAYFVEQNMLYHRFSTHFNIKVGWQFLKGERLLIDFYTGLSLRRNNVISNTERPEGGQLMPWWNLMNWELRDGHKYGYATPIIGFRIGWHIPAQADI
ncbi:MAG: hypothetical protein HUJ25_10580 [Crocinitomicaceae bacterium]|nr:hypothetical protein [Crocinitomicaceae bacterium]